MSEDVTMTQEEVEAGIEDAEAFVAGARAAVSEQGDDDDDYARTLRYARLSLALFDVLNDTIEKMSRGPTHYTCFWCFGVAGCTDEAWQTAPRMTRAEMADHAVRCEHNPLVQKLSVLGVHVLHAEAGR